MTLYAMTSTSRYTDTSIITDIRRNGLNDTLLDEIRSKLEPIGGGEKQLPTLLLYDEEGLRLFEKITYLDEYYLTNAEIEVLTNHASEIANWMPPGTMMIELGSGYA